MRGRVAMAVGRSVRPCLSQRAHVNVVVGRVRLSGIRFSVDGGAGFRVAALNCCQSIHETGSKQSTWCDDKHE